MLQYFADLFAKYREINCFLLNLIQITLCAAYVMPTVAPLSINVRVSTLTIT